MKTIGLIGGMSWESSTLYYQLINRQVQQTLGGVHSCQCLMYSLDFGEIARLQHDGNWEALGDLMADAASRLERGGADMIVLCTNTMHNLSDHIENAVSIPLIHIVDATSESIKSHGLKKVGMLATRFSMEQGFLIDRYRELHGINVIVPDNEERTIVHDIIYNELVKGVINATSKSTYLGIIQRLINEAGVDGIIAGCTEVELLVRPEDIEVPLFETAKLHAEYAVGLALSKLN